MWRAVRLSKFNAFISQLLEIKLSMTSRELDQCNGVPPNFISLKINQTIKYHNKFQFYIINMFDINFIFLYTSR